jgi:hypothetical protein
MIHSSAPTGQPFPKRRAERPAVPRSFSAILASPSALTDPVIMVWSGPGHDRTDARRRDRPAQTKSGLPAGAREAVPPRSRCHPPGQTSRIRHQWRQRAHLLAGLLSWQRVLLRSRPNAGFISKPRRQKQNSEIERLSAGIFRAGLKLGNNGANSPGRWRPGGRPARWHARQ